jgi:predicted metal-dependent hydrolase
VTTNSAKVSWTGRAHGADRRSRITVGDIPVDIRFKAIKNLHLAVYPPDGRVRVAAPWHLDDDAVRLAVVKRLTWVRRQQRELRAAQRISEREMTTGESHHVWGRRLRLKVVEDGKRAQVAINGSHLVITVPPGTPAAERANVLGRWERRQLRERIPALLVDWEPVIGVTAGGWGIRRMKTKWGSYSATTGRVWVNSELAKKSPRCLEYIVVHELIHVVERGHGAAFVELMDRHLPDWRNRHHELNDAPLSAENWPD